MDTIELVLARAEHIAQHMNTRVCIVNRPFCGNRYFVVNSPLSTDEVCEWVNPITRKAQGATV